MPKFGLLIDYEFCIGCRSCEVACKQEHNRPAEEWGIRVIKVEPEESGSKLYYIPYVTDKCNLCGKRRGKGLEPVCVKHCLAGAIRFGTINKLARYMQKKSKTVLWVPH